MAVAVGGDVVRTRERCESKMTVHRELLDINIATKPGAVLQVERRPSARKARE